jgi:hypothetical protein
MLCDTYEKAVVTAGIHDIHEHFMNEKRWSQPDAKKRVHRRMRKRQPPPKLNNEIYTHMQEKL